VGPGAGLGKCGKSRLTGIRSPDLPARSESLYRLRYPGSCLVIYIYINSTNIPPMMIINRIYETQNLCRCSLFPSWSG
jgi:hypothetical protein